MKKLVGLFIVTLLASCATTPTPPPERTFQQSYDRPAIDSTAAAVDRTTGDVRREADALRGQVGTLRVAASEATRSARSARAELDRLIEQKAATEVELSDLSLLFKDLEQRNLFLETEAERLESGHQGLRTTIEKLEKTVRDLRIAATRKDEEVAELRQLLKSANDHNDALQADNERLAKAAQKAEVGQASAKTYRNILIWSAIGLFIALLLFVAIRTGLVSIVGR